MTIVRRIMEKFRMNEISGVDRPAQTHARMTIMKRADDFDDATFETLRKRKFTAAERKEAEANGHAMKGGRYPIDDKEDLENAIHAVGRGKGSHAAIRAHIKTRAKALGATDLIPDDWSVSKIAKSVHGELVKYGLVPDEDTKAETFDELLDQQLLSQAIWDAFYKATDALRESICSIIKDSNAADKRALIQQSLNEFAEYIDGVIPGGVGKSLATGFVATIAGSAGTTLKGETMSKELKKALGLPETATEAEVTAAVIKLASGELAETKAKLAKADVLAKMSAKHKAHHEKLEGAAADKFAELSSEDRDAEMAKSLTSDSDVEKSIKAGDAFRTDEGSVLTKRDFGSEAGFLFAKSQAAKLTAANADIAKAKESSTAADFSKRAVDVGQPEAFGVTLRKAYSGDVAAQAEVEKAMLALKKQADAGGVFTEIGKRGGNGGTAYQELIAKRDELRKADPKLKEAAAFSKVYTDPANAEIVKRYKAETAAH